MITVTYNGVNLSKIFTVLNDSRPLPEFRSTVTVIEGADGEWFDSLTVGPREVELTVLALDKSQRGIQDAARTLMNAMSVRGPKSLTFSDEKDKDGNQLVRYAVPSGAFDSKEFIRAGKWTLRFKQHDPYLYGKSRSVVLKANQPQKIQVGGNAETWAVAVSNPYGSSYTLGILGGRGITIDAPFAGEELTVDFQRERITVKPAVANATGIQISSRFFTLQNNMTLISNSKTTLSWKERWL